MSRRRAAGLLLGVLMSGLAATALAITVDFGGVGASLSRADLVWIGPAFAVLAGQAWIRAVRWSQLASDASRSSIPAKRVIDPMLTGYLVNSVLPGRVGELARTVLLARRERIPVWPVAASVVIERATDVLSLLVLSSIAAAAAGSAASPWILVVAFGMFALLAGARYARSIGRLVPARLPGLLARSASSFLESIASVRPRSIGRATAFSAIAWLADAIVVLLVARSLGLDISVPGALLVGLGGALGTALPAAPGYIATYELGAVAFGALGGVPGSIALPVAVIVHVIGVGGLASGGAISLGRLSSGAERITLRRGDLERRPQEVSRSPT